MSEFFHSTLFILMLSQSVAYLCDEYIGTRQLQRGVGAVPLFYTTGFYGLYRILSIGIIIVSMIISCIRYSWWLLIALPIVDFIASSILAAMINVTILKLLGETITRFMAVIITLILDVILILMWF